MLRFDQTTVHEAVTETRLMMETDFADTWERLSVPVSGSSFAVFSRSNLELSVNGFVDAAAASLHKTGSDYFDFRPVEDKMLFSRAIAHEDELPRLKEELRGVFLCQRAHVIAWSLWAD